LAEWCKTRRRKKPSKPDEFKDRKPIVAPYIERKLWYEKGPFGFIKDNKLASQVLKKYINHGEGGLNKKVGAMSKPKEINIER